MKIKRIYIEITNACNLRCSFCDFNHRPTHFLSLEEFSHILQQIKPITPYIYFHVQGEPLLHPLIDDFLRLCDEQSFQVQLVTNATFIEKCLSLLHHPSLRKLSLSLHSLDFHHKELSYDLLQQLIDNNKQPFIELRFWQKNNLSIKSKQCLHFLQENYQFIETSKMDSYKLRHNVFVHFDKQFVWPTKSTCDTTIGRCLGGKTMVAILSDGTVVPCCLDCHGDINLGNIFQTPLMDILQSERLTALVNGFNNNKVVEPLCQQCSYRHRFSI